MPPLFDSDDHYEDFGFAVVAEAGDFDIYVWEAVYIFKGGPERPKSQWLGDGVADHTMIVVVPKAWRHQGMHDNNYLRVGMSTEQYFAHDELEIVEADDTVTWRVGNMEYTSHLDTGVHEVRGEHGGCAYDLTFTQIPGTNTVPIFGELEQAAEVRAAGAYSYSTCSGTLTLGGRTHVIIDGDGLHEHIAFSECPQWDVAVVGPQRDRKGGGVYGSFRSDGLVCQIHSESPDETTIVIATQGEDIIFQGPSVNLERTDYWIDPKSGVSVPCRWHVIASSPDGTLDVELDGYTRGGWPWELKRCILFQTVVIATTNGTYTAHDGTVIAINDAIATMDYHRMLVCHNETLDGPDLTPTW